MRFPFITDRSRWPNWKQIMPILQFVIWSKFSVILDDLKNQVSQLISVRINIGSLFMGLAS